MRPAGMQEIGTGPQLEPRQAVLLLAAQAEGVSGQEATP